MQFTLASLMFAAASAYQGIRMVPHGSRVVMMSDAAVAEPAAAPAAAAASAAAAKPKSSPKPEPEEPAPIPLDAALLEIIASKKRLLDAWNEDTDASMDYVKAVVWNKETRKMEDLPGADTEVCNGELIGGAWDPLRLAETKTHLLVYREAEIKHGRLAMLAAAGWPVSELLPHGSDSLLQGTAGRAPSVLNGGLGEVNPVFWLVLLLGFAALENGTLEYQFSGWQSAGKPWKYVAGDYSFDPLNLQDAIATKWMETAKLEFSKGDDRDALTMKADIKTNVAKAEMWHGRVAMLAITGFAVQEAVWGTPVVEQSPLFFGTPFWHLLQEIF
jgi:light-harvesting complex II chlorophyll a/b binding protein 4